MNHRPLLAALLFAFVAGSAAAQTPCCGTIAAAGSATAGRVPVPTGSSTLFPPPGSSDAAAPSREALERLNLRSEWTAYVAMDHKGDGFGPIQVADNGQIFVQTKAGRLFALDAATGVPQWTYRYPEPFANLYPVGLTDQFVFAVNVNTLYCFARYTGALEFSYELPGLALAGAGAPMAGPVADDRYVYLVLGTTRLVAYKYPTPLQPPQPQAVVLGPDGQSVARVSRPALADQVAGRYGGNINVNIGSDPFGFQRTQVPPRTDQTGIGLGALQKTPSIAALPRITPPYTTTRDVTTPSISTLASLRRPYTTRPGHLLFNQQTPSISMMPPTVAAAAHLSNLRPKISEPIPVWPAVPPGRVAYEPILAGNQLWYATEGPLAFSVSQEDGGRRGRVELTAPSAAPPAGPLAVGEDLLLGFFSQEDGAVLALDLPAGGTQTIPRVEWRANVGGHLNHKPVITAKGIYASGESAGVARLDTLTGDVLWRTGPNADQLLALNDEFAYVRDRRGNLLIYPRELPNNPSDPYSRPVAQLDLRNFTVPVTNEKNDRILIGSDSGMLLCLRDASPKYNRPVSVLPPPPKPPEKKDAAAEDQPKADDADGRN